MTRTAPAPDLPLELHCPHCDAPLSVSTRARRDEPARCRTCGRHSALVDGVLVPAQPAAERGEA